MKELDTSLRFPATPAASFPAPYHSAFLLDLVHNKPTDPQPIRSKKPGSSEVAFLVTLQEMPRRFPISLIFLFKRLRFLCLQSWAKWTRSSCLIDFILCTSQARCLDRLLSKVIAKTGTQARVEKRAAVGVFLAHCTFCFSNTTH